MSRSAFLALPGLSVTTTLINIPCILRLSNDTEPPVIFVDRHDYDRLRREVLEDQDDTKKSLYLLSAYESLRQRGLVQVVDYANFYSKNEQYHNLQQNQQLLETIPASVNRRIAEKQAEGWINYGRGEYQEPFRESLGEDLTSFDALRRGTEKQRRKIKRGTNDPIDWNQKVLSRAIAGLSVRHQTNQDLKYNVQGVITGTEHAVIDDFISAPGDTSHIEDLQPQITQFSPNRVTQTRSILDTASEIATEITGVQYDDWFVLGPMLALPRYDDIFEFEMIRGHIRSGVDLNRLATETEHVLAKLKSRANTDLSPTKIQGEAEWIAETYDIPTASDEPDSGLVDIVNFALDLSDYSRELRDLTNQDALSQLAIFIGSSIMIDPVRQHSEDDIYRHGIEMVARLDPLSIDGIDLENVRKQRRSDMWDENPDWYEQTDRDR